MGCGLSSCRVHLVVVRWRCVHVLPPDPTLCTSCRVTNSLQVTPQATGTHTPHKYTQPR
jgi:hypothetical protein